MKTINGIQYKSVDEFLESLVPLGKDYEKEIKAGERYRAPGREALFFLSKKEAREFWRWWQGGVA